MREMVVEDIKTGVRTITQLALNNATNNKGIIRTIKTELFDPNFKSTDMSNVTDNNIVNVNYDNYFKNIFNQNKTTKKDYGSKRLGKVH